MPSVVGWPISRKRFVHVRNGYTRRMLAKLNLMKPLVVAGCIATAIAVAPTASAGAFAVVPTTTASASSHIVAVNVPGGGGCDENGNCGQGGQNGGPGGGPGGSGCAPGVGCGSGGVNAGPGGVPGGAGCIRASDAVPVTRSSLLIQVCDSAGSMTSSSSNVVAERNAFPC